MTVSLDEVHRLARLARLRLSQQEAERLRGDLNRILGHVHRLGDLEAGDSATWSSEDVPPLEVGSASPGVTPIAGSAERATAEAPDALTQDPGRMAPAWQDGFFLVPPPKGVEPERP